MFRPFRALRDATKAHTLALEGVKAVLQDISNQLREKGPAAARFDELERRQAMWEVEMAALVATATGKYEAANNAEARTRTMKKHYEKLADPFRDEGEEDPTALSPGDAPRGEAEEVHPLHLDVAPNPKAQALRYKFS